MMSRDDVIAMMKSSTSESEWESNCDKVKRACNGYPPYWFVDIISAGIRQKIGLDARLLTIVDVAGGSGQLNRVLTDMGYAVTTFDGKRQKRSSPA